MAVFQTQEVLSNTKESNIKVHSPTDNIIIKVYFTAMPLTILTSDSFPET